MDDYKIQTSKIQELANNPEKLSSHLSDNTDALYDVAPGITQALQSNLTNGVQFLNSKISKPSDQLLLSHEHEPSKTEVSNFEHYYKAVNDPISILDHVKDGTVSSQHIEALDAVHPHLFQEMKSKVIENMTKENTEDLPYKVKLAITKFIGQPIDYNMTGQAMLANQASFNGPDHTNQGAVKTQKRSSASGFKDWALTKRVSTRTQEDSQE